MKNGCVLAGGVGVGKTFTSLAYYVTRVCGGSLDRDIPMTRPRNLLVITTAKKRNDLDWQSDAAGMGIFEESEYSYGNVSIKVDSWNNIQKYEDMTDGFVIFDEQKVVGKGAWVKAFLKITKKNDWILLSATPADNWIDYLPVFLANGFFKTRSEFMNYHVRQKMVNGRYPMILGYYDERYLERLRDKILVEMPYERHTKRHLIATPVQYDAAKFDLVWKKRWNVYEECPLVDSAEMHRIGRKVVNSSSDRIEQIVKLHSKHPKMIIFYNFDYELDVLRTLGSRMDVEVAEWNGHKHQPVPTSDSWVYLVQYTAGAEGWNCITTDTVVYYSLTYSHKVFEQTQGRTDRMNTPFIDLYYYILISKSKIDMIIWRSLTLKKNFHEGRLVKFGRPERVKM